MTVVMAERLDAIKNIISEVLEIDPSDLTESSRFVEDHNADSLRAIEIMSRLERQFEVEIPQNELAKMTNLTNVYDVMKSCAGWTD
ncbi:MAG TPA: acyl carrier protein [Vicinamibacteria bacterium]|jgi:acyl carrier protein